MVSFVYSTVTQDSYLSSLQTSGITAPTAKDILAFGIQQYGGASNQCNTKGGNQTDAYLAFIRWKNQVQVILNRTVSVTVITDPTRIATVKFTDFKMIYLPSQKAVAQCSFDFNYTLCDIETALTKRKFDIQTYVNTYHGSVFALEETVDP
jgi:hypothetical protein